MKLLVLLFLVGYVSAFAPRHSYDDVLETAVDEFMNDLVGEAPVERLYRSEEEPTEYEKKLREGFEKLLEKVKEAIEKGKTVREDMLEKLKDLREKLREKHIEVGEKAKELYQKIKDRARDFLKNLLDKLGLKDEKRAYEEAFGVTHLEELVRRAEEGDDDSKSELEKKVREAFERLLEKVKEAVEQGKTIREDVIDKLQKLREKMEKLKIDLGERAKEMFKNIKEKAKDFLKNLLEKLGLDKDNKETRAFASIEAELEQLARRAEEDNDARKELEKKMREMYDRLLEKVKDAVEQGKTVHEDVVNKLNDMHQKMKDLGIKISERAKEYYEKIKEKAKDFFKKLWDRLGLNNKRALAVEELIRRAEGDDIEQKVRDAFEKLLEKVKEAIEQGKTIKEDVVEKLKGLREKMKELKIDMSEKAKEIFKNIKEKAKDFIKKILDKLGNKEETSYSVAQADFNLKKIFENLKDALLKKFDKEKIKQKIEDLFGKGSTFAENLLELLKTKGETGKQKLLDLIDRILGEDEETRESRSLQEVFDKVKDYFKNLKIELKEKYLKFGQWVKDSVKNGIDTSKEEIENVKAIAKEFIERAKKTSKDIAVEGVEFFRPYREDLGILWEKVKESAKEILKRED